MSDTVLITGGTGSIGEAIVVALRHAGAEVTFTYVSNEAKAHELEAMTGAHAIRWKAGDTAPEITRNVDVLVNNAAINVSRLDIANIERSAWNDTMLANLWGGGFSRASLSAQDARAGEREDNQCKLDIRGTRM